MDKQISIGIIGSLGRMGRMIAQEVINNPKVQLGGLVTSSDEDISETNYQKITNIATDVELTDQVSNILDSTDVIIDFSNPSFLEKNLDVLEQSGIPLVIGTTGFSQEFESRILNTASQEIPILMSPNMSLGINLLRKIVHRTTQILGHNFDIEITEKHHNKKKDAPSGTALILIEEIERVLQSDNIIFGRHGENLGTRPRKQIGVHAIRAGQIIGDHDVLFAGEYENITLSHQALKREVFAKGAVEAAIFMHQKPEGFYTMDHVLGLNDL